MDSWNIIFQTSLFKVDYIYIQSGSINEEIKIQVVNYTENYENQIFIKSIS